MHDVWDVVSVVVRYLDGPYLNEPVFIRVQIVSLSVLSHMW